MTVGVNEKDTEQSYSQLVLDCTANRDEEERLNAECKNAGTFLGERTKRAALLSSDRSSKLRKILQGGDN